MTVHCPTCHGQVVVPHTDSAEPPEAAPPEAAGQPAAPLFERSDFDAILQSPVHEPSPPPPVKPSAPQPPAARAAAPFAFGHVSSPSLAPSLPPPHAGLALSPTQATWLTVVAILLLALAFGAGLLVGHYWMG